LFAHHNHNYKSSSIINNETCVYSLDAGFHHPWPPEPNPLSPFNK